MSNIVDETSLRTKIKLAKSQGYKFQFVPAGQATPAAPYGTFNVQATWSDEQFEAALDKFMAEHKPQHFIGILKEENLI